MRKEWWFAAVLLGSMSAPVVAGPPTAGVQRFRCSAQAVAAGFCPVAEQAKNVVLFSVVLPAALGERALAAFATRRDAMVMCDETLIAAGKCTAEDRGTTIANPETIEDFVSRGLLEFIRDSVLSAEREKAYREIPQPTPLEETPPQ